MKEKRQRDADKTGLTPSQVSSTADSVSELSQTIEKLIIAMRDIAHRQLALEDQVNTMTKRVTELLDVLTELMQMTVAVAAKQPTESAPPEESTREEPIPRDQGSFYN